MKVKRQLFAAVVLLAVMTVNVHGQNVDVVETTTVKKVMVKNEEGELKEKQMKIVKRETQKVMINPEERHLLNPSVIDTPVEVTKTIYVDNDNDGIYDTTAIVDYKVENNTIANLEVKRVQGSASFEKTFRKIDKKEKDVYVIKVADISMVGYMDEKDGFVVKTL
jgi:hypothetical protein